MTADDVTNTRRLRTANVKNIDTSLRAGDHAKARVLTRKALEQGTATRQELAAVVVAYADERILSGDVANADEAIWQLVHDGVQPHIIFREIQNHILRKKGR